MSKKYEYRVEFNTSEEELNKLAAADWELVTVIHLPNIGHYRFYFKRLLK